MSGFASAQTAANPSQSGSESPCKSLSIQAAKELTFQQRTCFYMEHLIAPSTVLHGAFAAGFGQLRNVQHVPDQDLSEFGHRFGVFYARRTARNSAELLAGYLNHEDPRARPAQEHAFWNRIRASFSSVVMVKDADGSYRPALTPIAGALGSGMTSMAFYRKNNTFADGLQRSGLAYSCYFASALAHEFQPDLTGLVYRIRHRKDGN